MTEAVFHRNRPRRRRGFSVIEMLVVLAMITILSGMGVLAYGSFRRQRLLPEGARQVASVLLTARDFSISQNRDYEVTIDIDRDLVWVNRGAEGGPDYLAKVTTPVNTPDFIRILQVVKGGTTYTSGRVPIAFFPDGTAESATVTLGEEYDDGETVSIRVYHSTGRSRILP